MRTASMGLLITALLMGCSSVEKTPQPVSQEMSAEALERIVEAYSAGEAEYVGFDQNFSFKATIINSKVQDALIDRQTVYYQWDSSKSSIERGKAQAEIKTELSVFVSFFTPNNKNDNLSSGTTIWQLYLDVGGNRYQGKAQRKQGLLAELQALFPYHVRYNTPYIIRFPISTSAVENQPTRLTITGPMGTRFVDFPAL